KLRSYRVAQRRLLPGVEHRQSRYLNNRAENSHRPTRRRERQMQRFKSPYQAQHFLAAHAFIHAHFHPRRHLLPANAYRATRAEAVEVGDTGTCAQHTRGSARGWHNALDRPSEVNVTMPPSALFVMMLRG